MKHPTGLRGSRSRASDLLHSGTSGRSGARRKAARRALYRVATGARAHWLFLCLLAAGAALRAATLVAYRPALFGLPDSAEYLASEADLEPRFHTLGYPVFLRLLPLGNGLGLVPLVQHLLGLSIAVLLYALLVRLGVRRWLAGLATAPVLLDAYQLNIEQYVLSDSLFQFLLVAACVLLLWRRSPGALAAGLAGVALAAATLTRGNALLAFVPALLTLLFLRTPLSRPGALLVAFALPIAAYVLWMHSVTGVYGLTGHEGRFLYARVAPFADCTRFSVPARERVLCPRQPIGERPTVGQFFWSPRLSPLLQVKPPPGSRTGTIEYRNELARDFARRVIRNQPLTYARTVTVDLVTAFGPARSRPSGGSIGQWKFEREYPIFAGGEVCAPATDPPRRAARCRTRRETIGRILREYGDDPGSSQPALASFLRAYQRYAYTPGPAQGACLLVAIVAVLGVGRAGRSGLRSATFLFSAVAFVVFLATVAASGFTWRYGLPGLVLFPPAAAIGLTALTFGHGAQPAEAASSSERRTRLLRRRLRPRGAAGPDRPPEATQSDR